MRLPRISVVTPSLNQGRFIEDAVLSVAHQGYPDVEHIVIDGGSTDETLAVLARYRHLRWISEPDNGQSDAINKGFRIATGDLLVWLNADDYYLPGALHSMAHFTAEHPEVDIIYADSIHTDEDGKLLFLKGGHPFDLNVLLYGGCYIDSNTTFFRRSVVDEGLLLNVEYRVCMDFEYFTRLAEKGKNYGYLRRPLAAFRWHGSNASLQIERRLTERLLVQRTWSQLKLSSNGYAALAHLYRFKRAWLKLLHGTYWAELRMRRFRGEGTFWFDSGAGRHESDRFFARSAWHATTNASEKHRSKSGNGCGRA
jgi:glycosyltransferase involved in cell wall biosynthesis